MTRWLVTGATGLLGSNAMLRLTTDHDVIGLARNSPSAFSGEFFEVDLEDPASRRGIIERTSPDVVLHAAAIASIEACERQPERAHEVNVVAATDLAKQAADAGAAFVYISSDAVFDGVSGGYSEDDAPNPQTEYGRTKLAGERSVLDALPSALIARVNFYGWSPSGQRSLAEYFYTQLSRNENAPGFVDTVVSTLYVDYLVEYLVGLVQRQATGVVHVASGETISKYEFGRLIAETFEFDRSNVTKAQSSEVLTVRRGSQMGMNILRLESILGHNVANQRSGVERLKADYDAGRPHELSLFDTQKGN